MAESDLKNGETLDPTELQGHEVPAEDDTPPVKEEQNGRGENWTEKDVVEPVSTMMSMTKRMAEKRRQEEAEAAAKVNAAKAEESAPVAGVEPEKPVESETVKVKINHQEREVPKAEVDALGGVAAYQMTKAAEERLEAAKRKEQELNRRLEALERQARETAAPKADPAPAAPAKKSEAEAELEAAADAFDTAVAEAATKEEIAAARKRWQAAQMAVTREVANSAREETVRQAVATARVTTDIEDYNRRANAAIAKYEADLKDDDVRILSVANARKMMQIELEKATGVSISEMAGISDHELERYHAQAMAQNSGVRDISAIWEDAITVAKTRLNPTPAAATGIAPELAKRQERKASTPTSPSPSSVRSVTNDASPQPQKPVSGFIERQNKMRGMA